ncbi:patatin-like phospholipase family protein [Candidatus Poribacteria bacterium]|nr:patatin-like phospholipase family protein [Candidatus Poribacteria bacterium]
MGKVAVVLSGGGLRGLAHIGALRAIRSLGIPIHEYIGTSMGSLICSLAAGGMDIEEMERHALALRSEDILDLGLLHMVRKGLGASSLYRGETLHQYIETIVPIDSFKLLDKPLLVNSVELSRGEEVYWGSEGLNDVPVHEAVYASCAVPGIFPPSKIGGSYYVDGGVGTNVPVHVARQRNADLIIAVNLGLPALSRPDEVPEQKGILDIILQSNGLMMRRILQLQLREFYEYPLILIEPHFPSRRMFDFGETDRSIRAGERAALNVLRDHPLLALA